MFEQRYNSASDEQNLIHVGGVATVRIGDNFGDDVYNSSLTQDTCYKLSNHLGSVSFRARSSGSKVDIEEYYPFGDSSLRTWASKKYRYVGKEKDQESGLYYYGARYYAAWTCRFISTDPLAEKYNFWSSYVNAGNNPVNQVDVMGLGPGEGDDESQPDSGVSDHAGGNYNSETGIYTVVNGDWLSAIALRFGLTPDDVSGIAGLNGIEDPDEIKIGDTLLIPMKVPDDALPGEESEQESDPDLSDTSDPKEYYMNDQGFYIEGDPSFGEYVGNAPPTSARNELVKIKGGYYFKYTNNVFSSIGNAFGGDFVEKKPYSHAEESFNNELLWTAAFFVGGKIIGKLGQASVRMLRGV